MATPPPLSAAAPSAGAAPSSVNVSATPTPSSVSPPPSVRTVVAASQEPIAKRVVLPRCAAWFTLEGISAVEKRLLPEFFEHAARHKAHFPPGAKLPSSKTPQVYIKYRNYMVHAYRQQPQVYLTATACRRNLAGDACAIMRVHEFLTHWGIINYDVPPHAMPPALHANYALKPSTPTPPQDQPLATLVRDDTKASSVQDASWEHACERCGTGAVAFELSSDAKRKHGAPEAQPNGYAKRDLPLHSFALRPGSGVCDDCFLARSFPDGIDASDFVRVTPTAAWTPAEDARLMDAVSTASSGNTGAHHEACDWNQIAGKVKTKSAEACVVRFLELPLLARVTGAQNETQGEPTNVAPAFAYAASVNASVVDMAMLVRDVDPFVAKAAARAAIQAIKDLHNLPPTEMTATTNDIHGNGEPPAVKQEVTTALSPTADSVDVDMDNGSREAAATDDKAAIDAVAATVATASDAAGLAAIKIEPRVATPTPTPTTNGSSTTDVDMPSADDASPRTTTGDPALESSAVVTKETLAVVQEASHATAAALMATRADAIATATARGPMRDTVTQLLQNQLQQLELKMQQLRVLETAVATEKELLTRERHALYMDRLAFAQQKLHGGHGTTTTL